MEQQLQEFLDLCTSLQGQVKALTEAKALAEAHLSQAKQQAEEQAAALAAADAGRAAVDADLVQAQQAQAQLQEQLEALRCERGALPTASSGVVGLPLHPPRLRCLAAEPAAAAGLPQG
jgi:regulator of protease activity HflC (stomatin/prohibitin superfamily)